MAQRRSAEEVRQVVQQYTASGLSQREFSQQTGIKLSTWSADRQRMGILRHRAGQVDSRRGTRLMFGLGPATKIYIAIEGVDMRKYAPSIVMWSRCERGFEMHRRASPGSPGVLHIT